MEEYKNDRRMPCKYGPLCYRKNEEHHKQFKHLPSKTKKGGDDSMKRKSDELPTDMRPGKLSKSAEETKDFNGSDTSAGNEVSVAIKKDIPQSIEDYQTLIKKLFLVRMPEDFFSLWDFCKSICPENPKKAFENIGLSLVGPYDVLSGDLVENTAPPSAILCHWRYYYDPPEFQTIIKGDDKTLFHIGYFRDDPEEDPVFVASNCATDCTITPNGENIFAALVYYLKQFLASANPFQKADANAKIVALEKWATNHKFSIEPYTEKMKARGKKVVCKTFHHAGIVVPYDKETQIGYRTLTVNDADLKKMLKRISESQSEEERSGHFNKLQPTVTFANIANDECDFGTTLELGIDLFCYGSPLLHNLALDTLTNAYALLERRPFIAILKAHLENRKKGSDLSCIPTGVVRS